MPLDDWAIVQTNKTKLDLNQIESPEITNIIINDIVRPEFIRDIRDGVRWRIIWKKVARILYIISKILTAIGGMLAFFEPYFKFGYLAMISGCISIIALSIWHCGDSATYASEERTKTVNTYLKSVNIEGFPTEETIEHTKKL